MAGHTHDMLVAWLKDAPERLGQLASQPSEGRDWVAADSAVRWLPAVEVRPDLLFRGPAGAWQAVEVQLDIDVAKARRWPLLVAALINDTGVAGDLVVVTTRPSVAAWARSVGLGPGPWGTELRLAPAVVLIEDSLVSALLKAPDPELAFVAAWAMHRRHGIRAQRTVLRAVERSAELPEPRRTTQIQAIFSVLSDRLYQRIQEAAMRPEDLPDDPFAKRMTAWYLGALDRSHAEGHAKGHANGQRAALAEALLAVLAARGLALTPEDRARILETQDLEQLRAWMTQAVTVERAADLFEPA